MSRSPGNDPFSPGYGSVPQVWAGRGSAFGEHRVLLERLRAGRYEQARLLTGDRGVGKTAFLAQLETNAVDDGLLCVRTAGARSEDLVVDLLERLSEEIRRVGGMATLPARIADVLGHVGAVQVGPGGVRLTRREPGPGERDRRALTAGLIEAASLAHDRGAALLLLVDESQNLAERSFAALWHALQEAQSTTSEVAGPQGEHLRQHLPLGVYVAGLPGVLDLGRRAGVTFSERVRHLDFGLLPEPDVREGFRAFLAAEGVAIDTDALDLVVHRVAGYPYFLHLVGRQVWRAGTRRVMTTGDVRRADGPLAADLARFYGERLRPLGELQYDWLREAAELVPEERTVGAVAARLGRRSSSLGSTFAALAGHGLVRREPGRGRFALAVPGLDGHLRASVRQR